MKSFKCLIFLITVFLTISFININSSYAVPDCPSGYTYNLSTNRCEVEPICENGFYDPEWNFCRAAATHTCSSLSYDYNPSTRRCEAQPLCCPSASLVNPYGGMSQYCDEGHRPPCQCPGYGGIDGDGIGVCRHIP